LNLQNENARLRSELEERISKSELLETKLNALEAYSSDLQTKYDSLAQQNEEKAQALRELMQNDLPNKVVEYKQQIKELRNTLHQKESEKEQYLANFEGGTEAYSKNLIERQASELLNLQHVLQEHERRQQTCEKKWTSLMNESQLNQEQA